MADVREVLDKAYEELESARQSDLPSCQQIHAQTGIGYAILGLAMIVEDVETRDDKSD